MRFTVSLAPNSRFQRLYGRGKRFSSPTLVLYCRRTRPGTTRLGITVGSKLGHAVVRNRIRRRIKEIYRLSEAELSSGAELVVVARAAAVGAEYSALESDLRRLLRQAGLFAARQGDSDR